MNFLVLEFRTTHPKSQLVAQAIVQDMAGSSSLFWCGGGVESVDDIADIAVYSYHHVYKQVRKKAYLFCHRPSAAVMFASNPDGREWRRSEWQCDPDDTRYGERNGQPYWAKFCWGGKAAEALCYPVRTLMIEALEEKGQYVAYEGGNKERPWAFLMLVDEQTPEWATAIGILQTAKEVDSEYVLACRSKYGSLLLWL